MSLNVAPVAAPAGASTSGYQVATSPYNWTHYVDLSLPNKVLLVCVSVFTAGGSVSSVTLGAQSLALVRADASGIYRIEVWRLVNPAEGAGTVTVTLSGAITSSATAMVYANVDPTTPVEAQNTATGTGSTASGSVTTVTRRALAVAALTAQSASGVTSSGGQTARATTAGALGTDAVDDKGPVDPAGSTTLSWTGLGVGDTWVIALVSLAPAPTPSISADWYKTRPRSFSPGLAR